MNSMELQFDKICIAYQKELKNNKKSNNKNTSYTRIPFDILDNHEFLSMFKSKMVLYLLLQRYIIRKDYNAYVKPIYDNFYTKGKLASLITINMLAEKFNLHNDNKTIKRWLKELSDEGIIQIEKLDIVGFKKQNIYILGTHKTVNGVADEHYFISEKYSDF